jgi:hypothetical protein
MDTMLTKTGAPNLFSTSSLGSLKVIRNAQIIAASGCPPAALTLEFRIGNQGFVSLLISEMKALGYDIAQMVGVLPLVALCIVNLCFYRHHNKHSFWNNSLAGVHTRLMSGRFINAEEGFSCLSIWLLIGKNGRLKKGQASAPPHHSPGPVRSFVV